MPVTLDQLNYSGFRPGGIEVKDTHRAQLVAVTRKCGAARADKKDFTVVTDDGAVLMTEHDDIRAVIHLPVGW